MPQNLRRYSLKEREVREVLEKVSIHVKIDVNELLKKSKRLEVVEGEGTRVFLFDEKPLFAESQGRAFPTLKSSTFLAQAARAVVDMGAIKHVCNGADIMAPGIVRFIGEFEKGNFLLVVDEKFSKPIAIGEALCDSEEVKTIKKGPVIENRHFVGDETWNIIKTIT